MSILRRRKKRLVPILYREEDYDGYGYSDSEEERYYPEVSRVVRERFIPEVSGGGSLLYFGMGMIIALLLVLVLSKINLGQRRPTSKHIEVSRDERGKLIGLTTLYDYD